MWLSNLLLSLIVLNVSGAEASTRSPSTVKSTGQWYFERAQAKHSFGPIEYPKEVIGFLKFYRNLEMETTPVLEFEKKEWKSAEIEKWFLHFLHQRNSMVTTVITKRAKFESPSGQGIYFEVQRPNGLTPIVTGVFVIKIGLKTYLVVNEAKQEHFNNNFTTISRALSSTPFRVF